MSDDNIPSQIPFFRLFVPFALGIASNLYFTFTVNQLFLTYALVFIIAVYFLALFLSPKWQFRWFSGLIIMLFLFLSDIVLVNNSRGESNLKEGINQDVLVRLLEPIEGRTSSYRSLAKVEWRIEEGAWLPMNEKVMLYFSANDSSASMLQYGTILAVNATFTSTPKPLNPYQFDYNDYLAKKQVYRVAFVPVGKWMIAGINRNSFISFSFDLREKLLCLYRNVGIEGENLAVLSALTMGYKSLLDQETRRVFSASGAMHILAVSGLHVGILFSTISAFLFFLGRIKRGKVLKAFLLVCFLWFFAIFTGLSPSVIRATLMFSLVIVGTALNRKTSIYNTLSASAFVILAINPLLIAEVGFQLSYLAVLSIVFFYPYIYELLFIKNRWLDKVWVLIAVSFAAQIGTFALGLYYFNQFPNYFLFTNLYAIPLAFMVLYLSIALIICSPLPLLLVPIGWLLDKTLSLLNFLVRFTESLPSSTSSGIFISLLQTALLISFVILLAFYLERKRFIFLLGAIASIAVFFLENAFTKINQANQSEMVVFSVKSASVIGFVNGNNITIATTDSVSNPLQSYSFSINGYINQMGLTPNENIIRLDTNQLNQFPGSYPFYKAYKFGSWFTFSGRNIFFPIGNALETMAPEYPLGIDILILGSNSKVEIDRLLAFVSPALVIVDSSVPFWKLEKIEAVLTERDIQYHFIERKGAFILN
jgi:competence protein ComEC